MANTSNYRINQLPRSFYSSPITYTPEDLRRQDESPDSEWYSKPRFVQHIDDGAISTLKLYYGGFIQPTHSVLDICSSWVSHLPSTLKPIDMVGIGMNLRELQRNEHLTDLLVKDLNRNPNLEEIQDSRMDVVMCNVSVDYLTQPVLLFKEIHRVLKIGGTAHMAFSDRCFPTKVIGKWRTMSDAERRKWVGGYFWASGEWEAVEEVILKDIDSGGRADDPLFVVRARKPTQ